jgi:murein DD-endopeptidase MepM/ murein hydrolase activator NlpD
LSFLSEIQFLGYSIEKFRETVYPINFYLRSVSNSTNSVLKSGVFLLSFLAFSCTQKPAPIVHKGNEFYGRNHRPSQPKPNPSTASIKQENVAISEPAKIADTKQKILVLAGDNLYSISKKYQVTLRDLIDENELKPPYILVPGRYITIPSPNYHVVNSGDTLYAISRLYNMKVEDLIKINKLQAPYAIKAGDKMRVGTSPEQIATSKQATKQPEPLKMEGAKPKEESVTENAKTAAKSAYEKIVDKDNRFAWPTKGPIISNFGPKSGGLYNDGINIKAAPGSEVKASEDGVVAYVGNELKGYGNLIIIKHSSGWITAYAHLDKYLVSRGQKISKGELIGHVGSTGNVTSPQLYFGLRKGRDAVNPENYLKSKPAV